MPITSSSQNTFVFDSIQIKEIALICAENQKLNIENPLLKQKILSLEELNSIYIKSDSIRKLEIDLYKDSISSNNKTIRELKSRQTKTALCGILLFILGLLL